MQIFRSRLIESGGMAYMNEGTHMIHAQSLLLMCFVAISFSRRLALLGPPLFLISFLSYPFSEREVNGLRKRTRPLKPILSPKFHIYQLSPFPQFNPPILLLSNPNSTNISPTKTPPDIQRITRTPIYQTNNSHLAPLPLHKTDL